MARPADYLGPGGCLVASVVSPRTSTKYCGKSGPAPKQAMVNNDMVTTATVSERWEEVQAH